ncbi:hypothetical protein GCM10007989_07340 [Devosia pacifica]|uniref:Peptidase S74 domain-containing protein n=1 Tax=Devosia pacifica TaxID=1335967 RepID=A0A918VQU4_9HYPH|nr:tail fiber domain-containing protein [Devosia pacifica]GHA15119.1 hypothetical protein GCM10007989_07340 [Devosia pacifica]
MGKMPSPPDPKETSQAQTGTNVGTAIANAMMNNVSQNTPDGSLQYDQTGTYNFTDPYTGQTYDIPTFTATQTLSPEQERIRQQNTAAQGNLASIANERSGFLRDYLGKSIDTSGLPALATSAGQTDRIGGSYETEIGRGYDTSYDRDIGGNYTDTYAGADDFSADRQRVEEALWSRGADRRASEDESLRTRLLNSGLREGTAAWNSEMERLGRQVADERIGTMLASGQEQSRLVGLARDAAVFGNQASLGRAQFSSDQQSRQNASLMERFGAENAASLAKAEFGNRARLNNASFRNSARQQGLQEAYAARSQPLNEVIGLMSGSQIQQPNFVNTQQPTIPTTDNAGIINENYQQRLQQWQANQGLMGGFMGGIGSLIGLSDDDAKTDKKKIGHLKEVDLGVHEYRYKGEPKSAPKHIGVMASEVEKKNPDAVTRRKGLRYVDYSKAVGG